jgi:hypothetical protein
VRDDFDALFLELSAERDQVLFLELVRHGERLEGRLLDGAEVLGLMEKRLQIKFSKVRQRCSAPLLVPGSYF